MSWASTVLQLVEKQNRRYFLMWLHGVVCVIHRRSHRVKLLMPDMFIDASKDTCASTFMAMRLTSECLLAAIQLKVGRIGSLGEGLG